MRLSRWFFIVFPHQGDAPCQLMGIARIKCKIIICMQINLGKSELMFCHLEYARIAENPYRSQVSGAVLAGYLVLFVAGGSRSYSAVNICVYVMHEYDIVRLAVHPRSRASCIAFQ